jgi:hypothetical protein
MERAGIKGMDRTPGENCKAFWDHLITRYPVEQGYSKATKHSFRWRELPKVRLIVGQWVSFAEDWVGIYIRGEKEADEVKVRHRLETVAKDLGKLIGSRLGQGPERFFQRGTAFRTRTKLNGTKWRIGFTRPQTPTRTR